MHQKNVSKQKQNGMKIGRRREQQDGWVVSDVTISAEFIGDCSNPAGGPVRSALRTPCQRRLVCGVPTAVVVVVVLFNGSMGATAAAV